MASENLKIALAYSGGLDTSTIIPWLRENYPSCEIHAVCVDVGQVRPGDDHERRALEYGAASVTTVDASREFVEDYLFPLIKSGAVYEGKYLLGTSIARPLIAAKLIEQARARGCDAVCHGATGKGNDQVRFELTIMALAPQMRIIAPWRIWDIRSRQDAMDYLAARGIHLNVAADQTYSRDENLWHLSHEGLELENPANAPEYSRLLQNTVTLKDAPDEPAAVTVGFRQGVPVSLDGEETDGLTLISRLNAIGGANGVGVADMVENRVVGMKSRGVYETPAGTILRYAHSELERLTLDRESSHYKETVALKYADLVYNGQWFLPLRKALDAFIDETQKNVTGEVRLSLYKGNVISQGATSPYSLYSEELASFTTGELYSHADAEGFIKLYGLPMKMHALTGGQADKPL